MIIAILIPGDKNRTHVYQYIPLSRNTTCYWWDKLSRSYKI